MTVTLIQYLDFHVRPAGLVVAAGAAWPIVEDEVDDGGRQTDHADPMSRVG